MTSSLDDGGLGAGKRRPRALPDLRLFGWEHGKRVAQSPCSWGSAAFRCGILVGALTAEELFKVKSRRVAKAATLRYLLLRDRSYRG
jgi:hypothetical protein